MHQDGMELTDTATGAVIDDEYAGDVACSELLSGPRQVPFAYVMSHQDDAQRMWKFLNQWYTASTTLAGRDRLH